MFGLFHAFTVAALLCALVSRVALTLKGALCIDALAVRTQSDVLALINVCVGEGIKKRALSSDRQNMILDDLAT